MKVVIIDYGAGNVFSVTTALQRLGVQAVLSSDVRLIARAERVIFPGVGQAAAAMKQLKDKGLDRIIPQLEMPVDRKSTRLNSSHREKSRMPSSA